jgi:DNA-binding NarL/FixJ family response regulator
MLVIEDDQVVAMSAKAYFEDYDFEVTTTGNGAEGMNLFRDLRPDVVLTDLNVPGIDGLEVLHQVRQESPETPILVISGSGTLGDVVQALRLGAWDYQIKPFPDLSILRYAVERAMERARLLHENREYHEHLEEQIASRTNELKQANEALANKNVALREVLAAVQAEKAEVVRNVMSNLEKVVFPSISALSQGLSPQQQQRVEQIESSLRDIACPFTDRLTRDAARLSPMELRVSTLIRRGLTMKEIASIESISPETVATHRRAIRKKLGITNSKVNLVSFLDSYLRSESAT